MLPGIVKGNITIDASNSGVIIDGSRMKDGGDGLVVLSGGNIVKGLQIVNFRNSGINMEGSGNIIGGDRTKGGGPTGEGNVISCNFFGIDIKGKKSVNNIISGNLIGLDADGEKIPGKQDTGIFIRNGASNNIIGGRSQGERNIISGNEFVGVNISDKGTQYNKVTGNYIGTDINGVFALGQITAGVFISSGASCNTIGGANPAEKNVISGNKRAELSIMFGANSNTVTGNYIGVDASGKKVMGASVMGLSVECAGVGNIIGKNTIYSGVIISDAGSNYNRIAGNYIGISADCATVFGSPNDGISLNASFNVAGGTGEGEGNVICGCSGSGIKIGFMETEGNIVIGNSIGIAGKNRKIFGNASNGISLTEGSKHTIIGGAARAEGNTIGGSKECGVRLQGSGVNFNFVLGNCIGTDTGCKTAFGNKESGINIVNGNSNFILGNHAGYNGKMQIAVTGGSGNKIYRNNIIGRGFDYGSGNFWDLVRQGNYWSDYKGKDSDKDGIGDTPYKIPDKGLDRFPMMKMNRN